MPKLLIKFASRSRPEKFFAALDNITSLIGYDDYVILASLDKDDGSMDTPEVLAKLKDYPKLVSVFGESKNKIAAINRDFSIAEKFEWEVCLVMSDDFEFLVQGFGARIMADMEKYFPDTDGCLWYNDGTLKGHLLMTMSVIGRKYYDRQGYIYNPLYESVYADDEETRNAIDAGKIVYSPDILFKHNHWLFDRRLKDAQSEITDSPAVHERDRQTYLKRNPVLLITYATRGRQKLFFETIENIYSTIKTKYFKIIVSADADDVSMNDVEVRKRLSAYKNISITYGAHTNKVEAINRTMQFGGDWSWNVNMSDDMKFLVDGWDEKMLREIQNEWGDSLDFFAHFSDNRVHEKLPTMSIMGRDYYKRFNYIYHPSYKSVSCDAEQMFVAMMLGRHKYFPTVYFDHVHPAHTGGHVDQTYRGNDQFGDADTENYFARRKRLFDVENPIVVPFNPDDRN